MYDLYIAAPLFNTMERQRNRSVVNIIEGLGHKCFLPQRDGGEISKGGSAEEIYGTDIRGLEKSDGLLAFLDGAHVDEGVAFEIGYMTAKDKPVYIIHDDVRWFSKNQELNNMFRAAWAFSTLAEFIDWWEEK